MKYPGDVSTSVEAYLALKILGVSVKDPAMDRARCFIIAAGGVEKVRIFTRIYLATFGLFPWKSVPELPAELILVSASSLWRCNHGSEDSVGVHRLTVTRRQTDMFIDAKLGSDQYL